jgi:glutamine amidotransferase
LVKISIIDYGLGNLRSLKRSLEKVQSSVTITREKQGLIDADAIVLPGVGAFEEALKNLKSISSTILEQIEQGKPTLGICLGLQLLFTTSTEGGLHRGLDVFKGKVVKLSLKMKIPHMGWNTLKIIKPNDTLFKEISDGSFVYFVHSFYAEPDNKEEITSKTFYGIDFASSFSRQNLFLTQFHPEKSGETGLQMLQNFVNYLKR